MNPWVAGRSGAGVETLRARGGHTHPECLRVGFARQEEGSADVV